MRYRPSPLLLLLAGGFVLLFAGLLFWAREFAVTDPALAEYGRGLLPPEAEVKQQTGYRYQGE
ncbi:hypothetical protein AYO38_08935 [bacterium SCGC AG-212-C10]|nr:hypothetical protein AYO38_08935 [bacterium SCGC AG-212-C10]